MLWYLCLSRFITLPFLARDPKAIEVVQIILETVLLRREKNMLDSDGKPIVDLPPKEARIFISARHIHCAETSNCRLLWTI